MRIIKCKWLRNFVTKCLKSYYNKYKKKGANMNSQIIITITNAKPETKKKEVNFKTINEALKPKLAFINQDNDLGSYYHIVDSFSQTINCIEDECVKFPIDKIEYIRKKLDDLTQQIHNFDNELCYLGEEL